MTDEFAPSAGGGTPNQAGTATPRQGGRWRSIIVIGVIVVFLAIVLYVVRNSVSATDLKVGDCFDIPSGATIKTVDHHPCTESHTAEVILVTDYTDGSTYPISLRLDSFIGEHCEPAFATYVGAEFDAVPDLSIGYFYPSRDSWENGERTITCYVARFDESPMVESVKGSATQ